MPKRKKKSKQRKAVVKNRTGRFLMAALIGILTSFFLALMHNMFGRKFFFTLTPDGILAYDGALFGLSIFTISVVALLYYFITRDVSETVAVFLTGSWALFWGLEDLFVYLQLGLWEQSYPWLEGTMPGLLATIIGAKTVTTSLLIWNVILSGFVLVGIVVLLFKLQGKIGLVKI